MTSLEIQNRFQKGELVIRDGGYVCIRTMYAGHIDHPWHDTYFELRGFVNDPLTHIMEIVDTRWWSKAHETALKRVLNDAGVTLKGDALAYLEGPFLQ